MLNFAFDHKHRVLLVTVYGIFVSEDLDESDRAILDFVAREGAVRTIIDYTPVQAMAVPETRLAERAQQPLFLPDRILVAPGELGATARAYGILQAEAGRKQAAVVEVLEEAYTLLGLRNPQFEPVERP
jgi:hypothetical protein